MGAATNGAGYRLRILNLAGHGLEWDAGRTLVFASLTNASAVRPGEIVAFDPVQARIAHATKPEVPATRLRLTRGGGYLYASHSGNGTVVRYLPGTRGGDARGQCPVQLAGEDAYLYVGTVGSSSVAWVRLDPWQRDATLELGREWSGRAHLARQIFPAPGAPRTVVVARTTAGGLQGITTPGNGFVVFDDALQRPRSGGDTMFQNGPRATVVQWGNDAQTIFGGNTETSDNFCSRYLVDAQGPLFQFM